MNEDRSHEIGYENLTYEEWAPLTGLPRETYEAWLKIDAASRRDVVGMLQDPEIMSGIREMADE